MGFVASSGNLPVDGATVNLMSGQTLVATTTTDSVGFYSFVDVSSLGGGGSYAVTVTLPKGFKTSTPSAMGFIWSGNAVPRAHKHETVRFPTFSELRLCDEPGGHTRDDTRSRHTHLMCGHGTEPSCHQQEGQGGQSPASTSGAGSRENIEAKEEAVTGTGEFVN